MATARNQDISFDDAMKVVEDLVKEIRFHRHGVHVAEVLMAGSLGQHTAVPGDYDIDLVIYSDNINPIDVLQDGYDRPLHKLRSHMGREWRVKLHRPPSEVSVNMRYESADTKIDVDILVSPNWDCPKDFFDFLTEAKTMHHATPAQMFRFSINASKWQVEFVIKQDDKVKELIRRAKAWKSREWPEGVMLSGRPKSYLITLLVLRAYETAKANLRRRESIEQRTTDELIEIVEDHQNANIYWEDYYKPQDYLRLFPLTRPRIVDPANPANNLHESGIIGRSRTSYSYGLEDGSWTELVRKIDTIDLTRSIAEIQANN